jgi:hypothetical protein
MRSASRSIRRMSLLVVCAVALVGCGGQVRDPTEYGEVNSDGEGYYGNLMYGCTGVEPNEDGDYVDWDEDLGNPAFCECLFRGLKEKVPFDDAKKFDEDQAKAEPGELTVPNGIAAVRENCGEDAKFYD